MEKIETVTKYDAASTLESIMHYFTGYSGYQTMKEMFEAHPTMKRHFDTINDYIDDSEMK